MCKQRLYIIQSESYAVLHKPPTIFVFITKKHHESFPMLTTKIDKPHQLYHLKFEISPMTNSVPPLEAIKIHILFAQIKLHMQKIRNLVV
jgi:hypothetical protein